MKITDPILMLGADDRQQKVKDKAPVCDGIETFNQGMRPFAIYDDNGYMRQFGQEIKA